jgi:uncharacterized protein
MADPKVVEIIRRYFDVITRRGIAPAFGVLFGSQVTGDVNEWSDIDLVVVSPLFDTNLEYSPRAELWRATVDVDSRIEPIACGVKQWEVDDGTPILEVARREGVRVEVGIREGVGRSFR